MLDKFKQDISHDLIEFVNSNQFARFEKILSQLYLSRLVEFQNNPNDTEVVSDKKALNIYLNLPRTLELMANEVLEAKRLANEQTKD